ncbi:MAG TPA: cytochrome b [Steroidobacteraceae bacterium]|nr:cytochrome b [Steroidobacteraceae bacterium]
MLAKSARYSNVLIAIHWLTALLVVIAYLASEGGRRVRLDPPLLHFATGMAVLVLVFARVIARAAGGAPPPASIDPRLVRAAQFGHALLYALLIAVPLTGWIAASRLGVPIDLYGLRIPAIAAPVKGSIGAIGSIHQIGSNALLILAGLHAAVALWHQFLRRDRTLERMSPF